jgi:hypothetical protein
VTSINVSEYISGGYMVVKLTRRPKKLSTLGPDFFLTISNCIGETAPDLWAVNWEKWTLKDRLRKSAAFDIDPDRVDELVEFAARAIPPDEYPNAFSELDHAVHFRQRFVRASDTFVVGIGLHTSLLASFAAQLEKDVNRGYGMIERLRKRSPLAAGGVSYGYEPLGFEACHFHSWLCNSLPEEVAAVLAIRPNANGLISEFEDAIRATEYIRRPGTGAEPVIWEPWLVVAYSGGS